MFSTEYFSSPNNHKDSANTDVDRAGDNPEEFVVAFAVAATGL